MGCTREEERVGAAWGELDSAVPVFSPNADVKSAGVLFALPSLLLNGLLKYCNQHFSLTKGYYSLQSLLIILAFAALLRIKSLERVRYCDPGELGKVVGLDRIPEVRTLRKKIKYLSEYGSPELWSKQLGQFWMEKDSDMAGILYVDGHVRVYHGTQTALPKRYVARQKLCLRGLTDYWVNDALGQPFFVITQAVNAGLLALLREKIIPELLEKVPKQSTPEELNADPHLARFGIVFDREGYSPAFFKQMWDKRIACSTYQKYVREDWPITEFKQTQILFPNGATQLAERGVYFQKHKLWVRQIRKRTDSAHQTALVTTDYRSDAGRVAGTLFSRWSQENFFKYMMEHYGIDRLIDYKLEKMDETTRVVNPHYKEVEGQIRSKSAKLSRKRAEYGALILEGQIEEDTVKEYAQKKSHLQELIQTLEKEIELLKLIGNWITHERLEIKP